MLPHVFAPYVADFLSSFPRSLVYVATESTDYAKDVRYNRSVAVVHMAESAGYRVKACHEMATGEYRLDAARGRDRHLHRHVTAAGATRVGGSRPQRVRAHLPPPDRHPLWREKGKLRGEQ